MTEDEILALQGRCHIAEQQRTTLVALLRDTAAKLTEWANRVEVETNGTNGAPVCQVHDPDDAVPGRICGRPMPCREHGGGSNA